MYRGTDRVQQVNWIRELAADMVAYSGAERPEQAEAAVDMWLNPDDAHSIDVPWWFGDHDRQLLVRWVRSGLYVS